MFQEPFRHLQLFGRLKIPRASSTRHGPVHRRAGIENRENNPMQSRMGLGASVADTLFWPRRDHRRFLLPRPGIQDEPRDFACRIPDKSDPGVIFVV